MTEGGQACRSEGQQAPGGFSKQRTKRLPRWQGATKGEWQGLFFQVQAATQREATKT